MLALSLLYLIHHGRAMGYEAEFLYELLNPFRRKPLLVSSFLFISLIYRPVD
jgi:hypothetical protein